LHSHVVDGEDIGSAVERRSLSLDVKAATQGMLGGNPPAAVALRAGGDAAAVGRLADAGVGDGPERISGREISAAVPGEGRDLEIGRSGTLLQREYRVVVDLALGLIEVGRREIGDAVDGEPETGCEVRDVGDLELAARCAKDRGQSRIRVDDAGD